VNEVRYDKSTGGEKMKKGGFALLAVLILFTFAACTDTQPAGSQAAVSIQSASNSQTAARSKAQPSQSASEAASTSPSRSVQSQSVVGKGREEKNKTSSQLDEIDSTLNSLKELTGSLDDVTSEDTDIS